MREIAARSKRRTTVKSHARTPYRRKLNAQRKSRHLMPAVSLGCESL